MREGEFLWTPGSVVFPLALSDGFFTFISHRIRCFVGQTAWSFELSIFQCLRLLHGRQITGQPPRERMCCWEYNGPWQAYRPDQNDQNLSVGSIFTSSWSCCSSESSRVATTSGRGWIRPDAALFGFQSLPLTSRLHVFFVLSTLTGKDLLLYEVQCKGYIAPNSQRTHLARDTM